ncbi:hypothetical protein EPUL_000502 [Erysiphe pulchra]|uniref:Uncharacterized protein n=1 Tax=Erysiphe pulchra TaxID=225359 RepID=A0A2S4Q0C1_9PEZI|nr:hypothetical protein EPUL_000502 [Erysiphe pulchra]
MIEISPEYQDPPSKRPLPDRISKNSSENNDNLNVFLPKELAEIIATRQRRECAWHVRLMICTTVLSNIDSTLANLNEDIEKDEAEAFKAYLKLFPLPTARVPVHTRPKKDSGNVKGKEIDRNLTKKVAVVTLRIILRQVPSRGSDKNAELPKNPQSDDNSWATARVKFNATELVAPLGKTSHRSINKDKSEDTTSSMKAISDKNFFLRLPKDHEWRHLSPAGIREVIVKRLLISPSLIGIIKPVHSGFDLSPSNSEAREEI